MSNEIERMANERLTGQRVMSELSKRFRAISESSRTKIEAKSSLDRDAMEEEMDHLNQRAESAVAFVTELENR